MPVLELVGVWVVRVVVLMTLMDVTLATGPGVYEGVAVGVDEH